MPLLSLLVANHAGVLTRVTSLFSRRGFNISSLSVGETQHPALSRITVQTVTDDTGQICQQLRKLEDVKRAFPLPDGNAVARELLLIKLKLRPGRREQLETDLKDYNYQTVYEKEDKIILSFTGDPGEIKGLLSSLSEHTIVELCRTGITAMSTDDLLAE